MAFVPGVKRCGLIVVSGADLAERLGYGPGHEIIAVRDWLDGTIQLKLAGPGLAEVGDGDSLPLVDLPPRKVKFREFL